MPPTICQFQTYKALKKSLNTTLAISQTHLPSNTVIIFVAMYTCTFGCEMPNSSGRIARSLEQK